MAFRVLPDIHAPRIAPGPCRTSSVDAHRPAATVGTAIPGLNDMHRRHLRLLAPSPRDRREWSSERRTSPTEARPRHRRRCHGARSGSGDWTVPDRHLVEWGQLAPAGTPYRSLSFPNDDGGPFYDDPAVTAVPGGDQYRAAFRPHTGHSGAGERARLLGSGVDDRHLAPGKADGPVAAGGVRPRVGQRSQRLRHPTFRLGGGRLSGGVGVGIA